MHSHNCEDIGQLLGDSMLTRQCEISALLNDVTILPWLCLKIVQTNLYLLPPLLLVAVDVCQCYRPEITVQGSLKNYYCGSLVRQILKSQNNLLISTEGLNSTSHDVTVLKVELNTDGTVLHAVVTCSVIDMPELT